VFSQATALFLNYKINAALGLPGVFIHHLKAPPVSQNRRGHKMTYIQDPFLSFYSPTNLNNQKGK